MALRTPLSVTPHLYMGDSTGRPLDMGTVYFGEQDKDPEFYPINLFSDDELTKPLMQPVHTKGGYLYDKGDMAEPHAKEIIYSVKVLDNYGRKVFYKGAMMRNSWNDDVIEQINEALVSTAEQSAQIAKDIATDIADKAVISSGFVTIDSFALGATITQRNEALRYASEGKLYRWAGNLPKTIPANSTPTSTGGLGANAWLEVSDQTLRSDIITGGLVTDTLVKTTPITTGALVRDQKDVNADFISAKDFAVSSTTTDKTASLQAATNFVKDKQKLHVNASYKLDESLLIMSGGVEGGRTGFSMDKTFTITKPIRQGWDKDGDPALRDGTEVYGGFFADITAVTIDNMNPEKPSVINNNSHFTAYKDVSIRGNVNPDVWHIHLNTTLFTDMEGCDIGGNGNGIYSVQPSYGNAYYGTNGSHFNKNNFNVDGTAAHLHGIFSFTNSSIESTLGVGKPRIIMGATGKSYSAKMILSGNYFECETSPDHVTAPLVQIQSQGNTSITHNVMVNKAGNNPLSLKPTCIKSIDYLDGSIEISHNQFRPTPKSLTADPLNLPRGIDVSLSASCYLEAIGNEWHPTRYPADDMIVINNTPITKIGKVLSSETTSRVYVRDESHGEWRRNMPTRDVWSEHNREQDSSAWKLSGGRNILLNHAPTIPITVFEKEKWLGASFRVLFKVAVTLKHGAANFMLAAKKDTLIPIGTVLEFVVDELGVVYEVGMSTAVINPITP